MTAQFDEYFMKMALREAEKAASEDEVPLGAVVVAPAVLEPAHDGHPAVFDPNPAVARILGRAHNMSEGMRTRRRMRRCWRCPRRFRPSATGGSRVLGCT